MHAMVGTSWQGPWTQWQETSWMAQWWRPYQVACWVEAIAGGIMTRREEPMAGGIMGGIIAWIEHEASWVASWQGL